MNVGTLALGALVLLSACGGPSGIDAGVDASRRRDGAVDDGGLRDAGTRRDGSLPDASSLDGARPDAGPEPLTVAGPCDQLDDELTSRASSFLMNGLTIPAGGVVSSQLTPGAVRILNEPNAGGSSRYSEALAFELLARCEGAALHATETEVMYTSPMPPARTDLVVDFANARIGVGVTRAFVFAGTCMRSADLPLMRADTLLRDKLADVADSTGAVSDVDRWHKQILFAFTGESAHAAVLEQAWNAIDDAIRGDTILYVVVSSGADNQIYFEDDCAP